MTPKEGLQIVEEMELIKRLRHAPSLTSLVDTGEPNLFLIHRDDLKILLQTRTEAANLFEQMLQ